MFGLVNQKGSCWVNAALQALFRIPQLQDRYDGIEASDDSPVDLALQRVWTSQGKMGLPQFYEAVKSEDMPAGEDIGDSHELLVHLCDKLPWLDKLFRFEFATRISCENCDYVNLVRESILEFPLTPSESRKTLSDSITNAVKVFREPEWTCEKCKEQGCTQQHLLASLPEILLFHRRELDHSVVYPSVLVLNKQRYALFAVVCYNGGHWWTMGRDLPPGKCWYTFDDTDVRKHDPNHFPLADTMRMLFYART